VQVVVVLRQVVPFFWFGSWVLGCGFTGETCYTVGCTKINGGFIGGYNPRKFLTIDPTFLGHPSILALFFFGGGCD